MTTIHVIAADGGLRSLEARAEGNLMELLKAQGLVAGHCGGNISCASCHVILTGGPLAAAGQPAAGEAELLEFSDAQAPGSRLACQIALSPELDGLHLRLPADA